MPDSVLDQPNTQTLVLEGPMIVKYADQRNAGGIEVPDQFWLAREAHVVIRQNLANDTQRLRKTAVVRSLGGSGSAEFVWKNTHGFIATFKTPSVRSPKRRYASAMSSKR